MSFGLERVQQYDGGVDGAAVDRNFDLLEALGGFDLGGVKAGVRFGVATVTWPGATPQSTTLMVAHGLPAAPRVVVATGRDALTSIAVIAGITATEFPLKAAKVDGTSPAAGATVQVFWLAVG